MLLRKLYRQKIQSAKGKEKLYYYLIGGAGITVFDEEDRKRRNVEFKEKSEDIVGKKRELILI